jgi:tetratricopeptide (TPR) repeat protein
VPLYHRILNIMEQQLGPNHPDIAQSLNNLALLYRKLGKYSQAEPLYRRALSISERQLGPNHPDTAQILNNLALLYRKQGNYEQAEPLYKRALSISEQQFGPNHPRTQKLRKNYLLLLRTMGLSLGEMDIDMQRQATRSKVSPTNNSRQDSILLSADGRKVAQESLQEQEPASKWAAMAKETIESLWQRWTHR